MVIMLVFQQGYHDDKGRSGGIRTIISFQEYLCVPQCKQSEQNRDVQITVVKICHIKQLDGVVLHISAAY
jgi:hypothetical protein